MIICAAIDVPAPVENIMICGLRHSDCYEVLHRLNREFSLKARKNGEIVEGFLATGNRFLNRREAYDEWIKCGQGSAMTRQLKRDRHEVELYSEDLY